MLRLMLQQRTRSWGHSLKQQCRRAWWHFALREGRGRSGARPIQQECRWHLVLLQRLLPLLSLLRQGGHCRLLLLHRQHSLPWWSQK